jgi:hypothetical protein
LASHSGVGSDGEAPRFQSPSREESVADRERGGWSGIDEAGRDEIS